MWETFVDGLTLLVGVFSGILSIILLALAIAFTRRYPHVREEVRRSGMTEETWNYIVGGPSRYDEHGMVPNSITFSVTIERIAAILAVILPLVWLAANFE
ncbi:MAG: hypothetical protein HY457_02315 [Parcubacteria group bacterium]|nr:hypothetical protein [Parcubacteria group bacterium]